MSGIFGVISNKNPHVATECLTNMSEQLSHCSWDNIETYQDKGIALGRLGIGVFNREQQPLYDDKVTIFFSGELYNSKQLITALNRQNLYRTGDADINIVLALYQHYGEQFIHQLAGAFLVAIWDKKKQQLLIANDRFGLYPLYYLHHQGQFLFAPEMKGVLCLPNFERQLDIVALAEYMRFQHLLGDKTFFEDVKLLPNGSLLHYDLQSDRLNIQPYWDFSQVPDLHHKITFPEAVEEASRLFQNTIQKLTTGPYQIGMYLSAGLDSRIILGVASHHLQPIQTVTFGRPHSRDVVYAQRLANIIGSQHHFFPFKNGNWVKKYALLHLELTEGFHSWIHGHGISILPQVRALFQVNLTGFGGGQTAVDWNCPVLLNPVDDLAFISRLFYLMSHETTWPSMTDGEIQLLYSPRIADHMRGLAFDSLCTEIAKFDYLPYHRRAAYFALCNSDRRLFQYYTVFHRSHIEQRFPFYDYPYLDFIYGLPTEFLVNRRLRREITIKLAPQLTGVPYDKDNLPITQGLGSYIVAKIIRRGKYIADNYLKFLLPKDETLYADYENWLRHDLRTWGEEIIFSQALQEQDIFNMDFVESLWKRHQSGLESHTIGKVAPIMTYEMMLRRFL